MAISPIAHRSTAVVGPFLVRLLATNPEISPSPSCVPICQRHTSMHSMCLQTRCSFFSKEYIRRFSTPQTKKDDSLRAPPWTDMAPWQDWKRICPRTSQKLCGSHASCCALCERHLCYLRLCVGPCYNLARKQGNLGLTDGEYLEIVRRESEPSRREKARLVHPTS